jgi:hypothetical protein
MDVMRRPRRQEALSNYGRRLPTPAYRAAESASLGHILCGSQGDGVRRGSLAAGQDNQEITYSD